MAGTGTLSALPASTVRLIGSTQVITSVFSVIKELLENSYDAGSTSIEVKLENYGLDKIEIRDNGSGIKLQDVEFMAQRHYTSKISCHADLEALTTYGFRGEALASLCAVSEVSVTTKSADDDVSMTYSLTNQGQISDKKPSHLGQGTTVTASQLFRNLPVRKQYHSTARKKKEELKKIEDLFISYGVIRPDVRLSLRHNKETVWQKNVLPDPKAVLLSVLGRSVMNSIIRKECHDTDPVVDVVMYIPSPGSDVQVMSRTSTDRCFMAVNARPVDVKEIHKLVRQYYCTCHSVDTPRHPIYYIAVNIPPSQVDVNIDPNKTKVMLQHMDVVKKCIETELLYVYGPLDNQPSWKYRDPDPKVKGTDEVEESEVKEKVTKYISQKLSKEDVVDIENIPDSDENEIKDAPSHDKYLNNNNEDKNGFSDSDFETSFMEYGDDSVSKEKQLPAFDPGDSRSASHPSSVHAEVERTAQHALDVSHPVSDASVKDVVGSEHPTDGEQDVVVSEHPTDGEQDVVVSEHPTEGALGQVGSESCLNISEDVAPLGVGEFSISDDVLDDTFSPTQQKNRGNHRPSDTSTKKTGDGVPPDPGNDLDIDLTEEGVSVELWSRGRGLASTSGRPVQPVTLLPPTTNHTPGKRPLSPSHDASFIKQLGPPEKRRAVGEKTMLQGQTTLYDLVDNEPVKRQSAFQLFVKDRTHDVAEDHPDADEEEIAAILKESWSTMPESRKQKYRTSVWDMYKKEEREKDLSTRVRKKVDKGRSSVRDNLVSSSKNVKKSNNRKENSKVRDLTFNLEDLKSKYTRDFRESQSQVSHTSKLTLIGPLKSCGSWVCSRGNKILLANPHRLAETILYHRLLTQHQLAPQPLDKPVPLTARSLGDESLLTTLESLANENWTPGPYVDVRDERITANGFRVRCRKDVDGQFNAELVGLATNIPMYSVADLSEVLDLITNTDANTLKKARPLKVINFLKGEAVRMMRQSSAERGRDDLLELLHQMEADLPEGCCTCLHDKTFFHQVFDVGSVPVACDDTLTQASQD
ncbi:PMS1 protein homolog 1-like isoform X1 [Haliotis rufescens]|uniref:PMS1 protein homolog 1-like isoform X1 n=1 Tax=Haliotis rufescens TaxID=6454 RepID=UPI00201F4DEC|nr:PMS1 protein homolog 1-like isoform X1 [Haliotis rufescens]XP_048245625.1 PMS1 protein homolog 1-like isoform X2 [Haliotis rufescens]XP_048245628.1 PMS1 protein homolog 1-like isoform X2 [Haliotis rufescens]XP_048245632.1 PMS1 protein homolog 1-like isoform X1 [Haliotis rufescens]XP_048245639.1 PMS1 protein homolog 1-like isoform X1 [Haliotis rufescens]